jgi:hypothetical protein
VRARRAPRLAVWLDRRGRAGWQRSFGMPRGTSQRSLTDHLGAEDSPRLLSESRSSGGGRLLLTGPARGRSIPMYPLVCKKLHTDGYTSRDGRDGPIDPIANPYSMGAGNPPPELAGREDQVTQFRILLGRLAAGRSDPSMIISGLRGVGKTVLLLELESIAGELGWVAPDPIEARPDTEFQPALNLQAYQAVVRLNRRKRLGDHLRAGGWTAQGHLDHSRREPELRREPRDPERRSNAGARPRRPVP